MAQAPVSPPRFLRGRYYGARGSDPATLGLQAGAYWYRTDLNCWKWFDGTTINFLPLTSVTRTEAFYINTGGGSASHDITQTTLSNIVYVVHVEVTRVEPSQHDIYTPIHWNIGATTIGVTIGAASSVAGTTVWVEALFLGYR